MSFRVRLVNILFGLFLYALGIVFSINANVGYAPWDVFQIGISNRVGLTLGTVSIIVGALICVIVAALGEKLGFGTILNMILIGAFLDLIIMSDIVPQAGSFATGIAMLVTGMFIIAFGSYFYMRAAFGAGPRDNLMVALTRKTRLPVGICRMLIELSVTLMGWLLGGMVGVGTIIAFVSIGVCVQIVFSVFKFDVAAINHETLKDTFSRLTGK